MVTGQFPFCGRQAQRSDGELLWGWSGSKPCLHHVPSEMVMKCRDYTLVLRSVQFRRELSSTDRNLKLWDGIHPGE